MMESSSNAPSGAIQLPILSSQLSWRTPSVLLSLLDDKAFATLVGLGHPLGEIVTSKIEMIPQPAKQAWNERPSLISSHSDSSLSTSHQYFQVLS